jgi:Ca2+-binding RTX toxin-like protein
MAYIPGTNAVDVLNGTGAVDYIRAFDGDDTLNGNGGDDYLDGGDGADVLNGGAGIDWAWYANAPASGPSPWGGSLGVVAMLSSVGGGQGDSKGDTYSSIENIMGSAFDDVLVGDANVNELSGGAGNDVLMGGGGADKLVGGDGNDTAMYIDLSPAFGVGLTVDLDNLAANTGEAALDTFDSIESVAGTHGNDILRGTTDVNWLKGGGGNDELEGRGGADFLFGDDGIDHASYRHSASGLTVNMSDMSLNTGDALGDTFDKIEGVIGSAFDDILTGDDFDNSLQGLGGNDQLRGGKGLDKLDGGEGDDKLDGGEGDDTLIASAGNDMVDGGLDIDTLVFNVNRADVVVSVSDGDALSFVFAGGKTKAINVEKVQFLDGAFDFAALKPADIIGNKKNNTLAGTNSGENINGMKGDDKLFGHGGDDRIDGGKGKDKIDGGAGDDRLTGGYDKDKDTLVGGAGKDAFVFLRSVKEKAMMDKVLDFNVAEDMIHLDNSAFAALADGALAAGALVIGTKALDADDRLIYDSAKGILSYDADGAGGSSAKFIANIGVGLALTEAHFLII